MMAKNTGSGHRLGDSRRRGKTPARFYTPAEPGSPFKAVSKARVTRNRPEPITVDDLERIAPRRPVFGDTLSPGRKRGYSRSLKGGSLSDHFMAVLERELPGAAAVAERERRFHPLRKWRFDVAWPNARLAAECDGGIYSGGAHVRGLHVESDAEKVSEAAALGWRVLRLTRKMIDDGSAVALVARALAWQEEKDR